MATQSKYLVSDILQIISDLRGESSVNSDAVRIRAIDRSIGDFSTRRFWEVYRLNDQTLTLTGAGDYEIGSSTRPYRRKGISEVFIDGTLEQNRCRIVNQSEFKILFNSDNSALLAYEWYDATNDKWMLHINPDTSGKVVTYTYYWQAPSVTSTTDSVYTPDPDIIARRALAYIYEGEDEEKYTEQYQLSEQMAKSWDEIEDTPSVGQTYSMTPQINYGLGSY